MSVITTVDERISSAKANLSQAYKSLLETLDEDIWGYSELSEAYKNIILESLGKIIAIKKEL